MKHMQEFRDCFVQTVVSCSTAEQSDDVFIADHSRRRAPALVEATGRRFRAKTVVVVAGSTPILPACRRQFCERLITIDDVVELQSLSAGVGTIGVCTFGLERGQSVARLGGAISGFDKIDRITDPEGNRCAQHEIDYRTRARARP
jgi:dihydrolipoamide dehydrogenase